MTFCEAIATQEGFYKQGSRAQRNNNPGNINFSPHAEQEFGAALEEIPHGYNEVARFAKYPTIPTGRRALVDLLTRKYLGKTLDEALEEYAPSTDGNNHDQYVAFVVDKTGLTSDTILTEEIINA